MRYAIFLCGVVAITPITVIAQEDVGNTPQESGKFRFGGRGSTETLLSPQDIDFYKFDIKTDRKDPTHDTSGNLRVIFSQKPPPNANSAPQSGWQIDLYAQDDLANSLYTATLPESSLKTDFEVGLSPNTYYFKISSVDSTFFPAAEYNLLGKWEENAHYEKQPNNDPDHATAVKANEVYYGNLSSVDDIDFYKFSLQVPDLVTISLTQTTPGADSMIGWQLSLVGQPQPPMNIPSTVLGNSFQINLNAGTHYFSVSPMPQVPEDTESEELVEKKAPIGRPYQIQVQAASVPPPPVECPFGYIYAQNPQTLHWGIFPTPCDIPIGWVSSLTAPTDYEVCPSPHASYKTNSESGVGTLQIPLLDYTDEIGNAYVARIELQNAVPFEFPPSQFQVLMDKLRVIRFTQAEIQDVEPPAEIPPVETPVETPPVETPTETPPVETLTQ
jgi:hypothetical protein